MWPIVADGVAWSACRSVGLSRLWALQKWLNRSRCHMGYGPGTAQGSIYQTEVQIPHAMGQFWGEKRPPLVMHRGSLPWAVQKTAEPIRSRYRLGRRRGWVQGIMYEMGVHTGATWRTRANRPRAALWPLVRLTGLLFSSYSGWSTGVSFYRPDAPLVTQAAVLDYRSSDTHCISSFLDSATEGRGVVQFMPASNTNWA